MEDSDQGRNWGMVLVGLCNLDLYNKVVMGGYVSATFYYCLVVKQTLVLTMLDAS